MGIPAPARESLHGQNVLNEIVPPLNERSIKSLSGNGMHAAVVGTLVLCVLKNVQHVSQVAHDVLELD